MADDCLVHAAQTRTPQPACRRDTPQIGWQLVQTPTPCASPLLCSVSLPFPLSLPRTTPLCLPHLQYFPVSPSAPLFCTITHYSLLLVSHPNSREREKVRPEEMQERGTTPQTPPPPGPALAPPFPLLSILLPVHDMIQSSPSPSLHHKC